MSVSVLSLQGLEGAEGVEGLWAGGLQMGVPCPALLSPCLSGLLPLAADRDQVPGRPCAALPTLLPKHLLRPATPSFLFCGGTWGLVALQGAASSPGTPHPPCPPLAPGCASPCLLPSPGPAGCLSGFLFPFFLMLNN